MSDPSEILYRLDASAPRRVFATGVLAALTGLLLWLSLAAQADPIWRVVLIAIAVAAAFAARSLWVATAYAILLTEEGLVQSDGRLIASYDQIGSVDRGMFALKPSNGFLINLTEARPFGWAPGLWWRWGKRVGVGGVTRAGSAKAMADLLALRIEARG
ncbi:hypothetical protein [Palleronia abyssalis]|uniref:DUF304 domain-containing protein n=1 Tax=Palleronia abyssalis TaxID=1501240 RepID=A0A2R8BV31_9RHOB|nr:hypothetical protein [Palleronia abyssalis]SPJ23983.1 hypothetical protein PAA8504_01805 [Palleronia abyssalis]